MMANWRLYREPLGYLSLLLLNSVIESRSWIEPYRGNVLISFNQSETHVQFPPVLGNDCMFVFEKHAKVVLWIALIWVYKKYIWELLSVELLRRCLFHLIHRGDASLQSNQIVLNIYASITRAQQRANRQSYICRVSYTWKAERLHDRLFAGAFLLHFYCIHYVYPEKQI